MAYGTVNADVIGTSVANTSLGAGNASIMKNRIINGAMVIDQRNAGASVTPASGAGSYTVDRFFVYVNQASKLTAQQNAGSVTPPIGFSKYLGITSSSAYSLGATDVFQLTQSIEGNNTYDLAWGTANAKTVTLSFQVYSSLTGTFGGAILNYAQTRSYPFSYTISSANTWTTINITIAGDTGGTWVGASNAGALTVSWGLGVGSTYSGTAGSWAGTAYYSATGATSVVGTNGATFYITGVQLEVGSSATGFEYRQYQQELALCQRYYQNFGGEDLYETIGIGNCDTTANCKSYTFLKVPMRTVPTFSSSGTFGVVNSSGTVVPYSSISTDRSSTKIARLAITGASGLIAGGCSQFTTYNDINARANFSAEL